MQLDDSLICNSVESTAALELTALYNVSNKTGAPRIWSIVPFVVTIDFMVRHWVIQIGNTILLVVCLLCAIKLFRRADGLVVDVDSSLSAPVVHMSDGSQQLSTDGRLPTRGLEFVFTLAAGHVAVSASGNVEPDHACRLVSWDGEWHVFHFLRLHQQTSSSYPGRQLTIAT
jgi:hypothetical protein